MDTIKLRITANQDVKRKFAVVFMGVKLAVAFGRDSGAKVGYSAILISGDIGSGGSMKNWYCYVKEGSVFELEVDSEFYSKNKNRIKNWSIIELADYSMTKQRSDDLLLMETDLE